ncbi:Flp pilus assembly protein CpaB [bacterium]|nr:Flp pilus assembly protein CpaB [bacterium]
MKKAQRLLVAVGLGLVTSGGIFAYVSGQNDRADAGEPQGPVVVAKAPIPLNGKIAPEMLAVETRPTKFIPEGALTAPDVAVGRVAKIELTPGEPLVETKLFAVGEEARAVLPVPAGMRAITVAVDEVVGVAGFVQPGMQVDVVSTLDVEGQTVTKFLLQRVKVLACAQEAKREGDPEAKVVSSATLAVSPSDAEKLILAADRGKIRLAMRDQNEQGDAKTAGATPESLVGVHKPAPVKVAEKPKPQAPKIVKVMVPAKTPAEKPTIMIIRGTSTEYVSR